LKTPPPQTKYYSALSYLEWPKLQILLNQTDDVSVISDVNFALQKGYWLAHCKATFILSLSVPIYVSTNV